MLAHLRGVSPDMMRVEVVIQGLCKGQRRVLNILYNLVTFMVLPAVRR
jgi:hypothetical protein